MEDGASESLNGQVGRAFEFDSAANTYRVEFDFERERRNLQHFLKTAGVSYLVGMDNRDAAWEAWDVSMWPTHFLVAPRKGGAVKKLAKKWSASKSANKFKICDTLSGDTAADRFGTIKDDYDMVVVSTSSFGEGDAPNGYGKFLYELQQGAKNGTKPLAGVLHAVLGYGSSEFETFQNCPRLTDKYLGECGSRRCVPRTEIDQLDEFKDVDAALDKFEAAVLAVLSSPSDTDSPPVCAWSVPGDTILEKKLNPMGYEEASLDSPNAA